MTHAVDVAPLPAPAAKLRAASNAPAAPRTRGVDGLLDREHAELVRLYEGAPAPAMPALDGDLRGRMLHVAQPNVLRALGRVWAGRDSFPWRGKSFSHWSATTGEGMNRVVSDRVLLFRFRTTVRPSRHDGEPCVNLDYDLPGNPFFIRAVEDEVRAIDDGLFLGQAWLRVGLKKHFVLWFGLERP